MKVENRIEEHEKTKKSQLPRKENLILKNSLSRTKIVPKEEVTSFFQHSKPFLSGDFVSEANIFTKKGNFEVFV